MTLNARSEQKLIGVHPDLVRVARRAYELEPFIVTCGLRTLEEQKALKAAGKSKTLNSRHLTGHAIDIVDPDGQYDRPDLKRISVAFKQAAKELGIDVEWGGDWKGAWDMPHWQLCWKAYPISGLNTVQKTVEVVKSKTSVAVTAGGAALTLPQLPIPPDLSPLTAWQGFGDTLHGIIAWAGGKPIMAAVLVVWLVGCVYLPSIAARFSWARS